MYLGGESRALCDVCLNLFFLRVKMDLIKKKNFKNKDENGEKKKLEEE